MSDNKFRSFSIHFKWAFLHFLSIANRPVKLEIAIIMLIVFWSILLFLFNCDRIFSFFNQMWTSSSYQDIFDSHASSNLELRFSKKKLHLNDKKTQLIIKIKSLDINLKSYFFDLSFKRVIRKSFNI